MAEICQKLYIHAQSVFFHNKSVNYWNNHPLMLATPPLQITWLAIIKHVKVSMHAGTRLSLNQETKFHLLTSVGKRSNQYHLV